MLFTYSSFHYRNENLWRLSVATDLIHFSIYEIFFDLGFNKEIQRIVRIILYINTYDYM